MLKQQESISTSYRHTHTIGIKQRRRHHHHRRQNVYGFGVCARSLENETKTQPFDKKIKQLFQQHKYCNNFNVPKDEKEKLPMATEAEAKILWNAFVPKNSFARHPTSRTYALV